MPQIALTTLIAGLLLLTSCGPSQLQIPTHDYGSSYTQFGRD